MSDIKFDTFRSSVFNKTLSDEETESETIDDFSQHSDMNSFMPDKLSVNSRSETPVLKNVSIVVSRNDNEIEEKISRSPSLTEEKDNSEDLMVEISKKTTIKKIISKTTLVNGVTKASEFEEFIIKNAHKDDHNNKHHKIKSDKEHAYVDFQKAMCDKITNGESIKKSENQENSIFENIEPIYLQNTWQDRKLSYKSSESFSENLGESKENFINGQFKSKSPDIDIFSEVHDHDRKKDLNTNDKLNEREKIENSDDKSNENEKDMIFFNEKSNENKKNMNFDNKFNEQEKNINSNDKLNKREKNINFDDKFNKNENHINFDNEFNDRENSRIENKDLKPIDQLYESNKHVQDRKSKRNFTNSEISNEKIMPSEKIKESINSKNEKENNSKTKTLNNIDNNLRKEKKSFYNNNDNLKKHRDKNYKDYILDYKIRKFNDKNNMSRSYNNYNENNGRDKRSVDYNDYRNFKSISVDSKPVFNSNFKHKEKNIKWVDPFKSYHLKYDLKDNGRSMQDWIKQKQEALNRSNSKTSMKNSANHESLTHKSATVTKSFSIISPNAKGSSHKDIKEFITRGNIKENLYRFRHPYPDFTESGYSYQQSYTDKEEDFKNFYDNGNSKSFEFLNGNKKTDKFMSEEKSNKDFNLQDSEILDNFDFTEQYTELTNSRDQNQYQNEIDIYRGGCRGSLCCCSPCYSCYSCLCMPCNCLLLSGNYIKSSRYTSYESPNLSSVNERKSTKSLNSRNLIYHSSPKTFNQMKEQFYSEESGMNKNISSNREIDILESRLDSIENKIHNMKLNGPNVYDCEMDLECQRRDIEKQLDCLYMFTSNITPKSSIKT